MLPFLAALLMQAPLMQSPSAESASGRWTIEELQRVSAEIQVQVEAMRGLKFKEPVTVKLTDKKGFIDYALKRQAETETPEKMRRDEGIAKLLGLVPAEMDLQQVMLELLREQVGGFYDPASKTFYLMDTFQGGVARIILAHELTHALDDQYYDLDAIIAKSGEDSDVLLAAQAVIEGSGTRLMNQWTIRHMGELSPDDLAVATQMGAEQLAGAPPYLWKPLLAAYQKGDVFLSKGAAVMRATARAKKKESEAKGQGDAGSDPMSMDAYVRAAFSDVPPSTEMILHPEKYWSQTPRDLPVSVSIAVDSLPSGWSVLGVDTLGELYLALLTTPLAERKGLDVTNAMAVLSTRYTNPAAEGWGGDRVVLLGRGDDRLLLLVSAWDSPTDADEFARALGWTGAEDVTKSTVIPTVARGGAGFVARHSATEVVVSRTNAADGTTPLVVVRVGSFAAADAPASDLKHFTLPWTVKRP